MGKQLVEPAHRRVAILEIAGHGPLALSRSSAADRRPDAASAMAVWTAVVDLPVPPFSLAKTMKCGWPMAGYSPCEPQPRI